MRLRIERLKRNLLIFASICFLIDDFAHSALWLTIDFISCRQETTLYSSFVFYPLFQNGAWCTANENFNLIVAFILMQINLIFIWTVMHQVSLWKGETRDDSEMAYSTEFTNKYCVQRTRNNHGVDSRKKYDKKCVYEVNSWWFAIHVASAGQNAWLVFNEFIFC